MAFDLSSGRGPFENNPPPWHHVRLSSSFRARVCRGGLELYRRDLNLVIPSTRDSLVGVRQLVYDLDPGSIVGQGIPDQGHREEPILLPQGYECVEFEKASSGNELYKTRSVLDATKLGDILSLSSTCLVR